MTTPITNDWNKVQTRTIDPYDYVDSDVTNKLLKGFGSKAFIEGLDVYAYEYDPSINTMNVILSSGVAIVDTTLVEFNQGICVPLFKLPLNPLELEYDLVLQYDYVKDKQNKSSAKIVSLKKGSYNDSLDTNLVLYRFTLNNWAILDLPTWNTWLNTNSTRLKDFRCLTGYVKRSGDKITGNISLTSTPSLPDHIVNKKYVDLVIGGGAGSSGFVSKNGDVITGPIKFSIPRTPTSDLELTSKGYNDSIYVKRSGDMIKSLMTSDPPYTDSDVINRKYANDTYLKLTGGTMTGKLMLYGDPASPMEATNKQYVDTKINNAIGGVSGSGGSIYVLKAGDTLAGPLYMNDNTNDDNRLATKKDIKDVAVTYNTSGNAVIQTKVKCATTPVDNDDLVNKSYVDNKVGLAGSILGGDYLKLTGGTMIGALNVILPVGPNNATTKAYVDSLCSRSDTHSHPQYIDVNGGVIDGQLQITKYPGALYDCANKLYVDDRINTIGSKGIKILTVLPDGTNTYDITFTPLTKVYVTLIGGGGAGESTNENSIIGGRGGGAGQLAYRIELIIQNENPIHCIIGKGGNLESAGGTTSFGSLISVIGGEHGYCGGWTMKSIFYQVDNDYKLFIKCAPGRRGIYPATEIDGNVFYPGGEGASTIFGPGGISCGENNSHIIPTGFGAGGCGGAAGTSINPDLRLGSPGAHGIIILEW